MGAIRKVAAIGAPAPESWRDRAGKPPYMAFIALEQLVVEARYQRVIGDQGIANVRRIVRDFRWSRFAPIIVAPLVEQKGTADLFAIIDGQHRVAALMALGERAAPAIVHEIDYAARADAFAALNVNVTALSAQAKFFARLESGDAAARSVAAAAARHRIEILKHNLAAAQMSGRQSAAAAAMLKVVRLFGAETLDLALEALVKHQDYRPGFLRSQFIGALATALFEDARLFKQRAKTISTFGEFDIEGQYDELAMAAKRVRGVSAQRLLAHAIKQHLQSTLIAAARRHLEAR